MKSFRFDEFLVDAESRKLTRQNGEALPLTPRVFDLLLAFLESGGRVLTKDELLQAVWVDCIVEESNLSQSIFVLRKALGETTQHPRFIRTIPHQGYRFIAPVRIEQTNGLKASEFSDDYGIKDAVKDDPTTELNAAAIVHSKRKVKRRVWALAVGGILVAVSLIGWSYLGTPAKPIESVAVLPFTNSTGGANSDYLTDGLTENIIIRLSRLQRLKVTARSVVSKYKGTDIDPLTVGKELEVGAVLVGRWSTDGERLDIRVELVETTSGQILWAESYRRRMSDLISLQEEIARRTTESLNLDLTTEEQRKLAKRYTENAEAYTIYLKGRYLWQKQTAESFRQAIDTYNQALEIDPNFALAYAGIANCHNLIAEFRYGPVDLHYQQARGAALKALAIDESLPDGHIALGWIKHKFDLDWAGADAAYIRAIELDPNNAQAHFWRSILLRNLGRFDEALAEGHRAYDLDPITTLRGLGVTYYLARRYDQAIDHLEKRLALEPDDWNALFWLSSVYFAKKMPMESADAWIRAAKIAARESPEHHGAVFANVNPAKDWRISFTNMLELALDNRKKNRSVSAEAIAQLYLALGNKEKSLEWLQILYNERSTGIVSLGVGPWWDDLRPDQRFQEILRKMNLENIKLPDP